MAVLTELSNSVITPTDQIQLFHKNLLEAVNSEKPKQLYDVWASTFVPQLIHTMGKCLITDTPCTATVELYGKIFELLKNDAKFCELVGGKAKFVTAVKVFSSAAASLVDWVTAANELDENEQNDDKL